MDELQSHVDDAIFVDAVQNTIPVPTKSWRLPSPDEIDAYVNRITSERPTALELEGICSNCLGFYLVSHPTILPPPLCVCLPPVSMVPSLLSSLLVHFLFEDDRERGVWIFSH